MRKRKIKLGYISHAACSIWRGETKVCLTCLLELSFILNVTFTLKVKACLKQFET